MVQILLPDGGTKTVDADQTAAEVIRQCAGDDASQNPDIAIIYFGHKLGAGQKLSETPHFDERRPMRLVRRIRQKDIDPQQWGKQLNKPEVDKLVGQCRQIYENLGEELQQKLETYMTDNKQEQFRKTMEEHPYLNFDPLGHSVVKDMRLLVPYVLEDKEFPYERPHCVQILKKAMQNVVAKNRPSVDHNSFPGGGGLFNLVPAGAAGPSGSATPAAQPPAITADMLNQALALALGGSAAASQAQAPSASQAPLAPPPAVPPTPAAQARHAQLAQLHEWGFTHDAENVQALVLADGDVEQALQILIAMREDMQ